MWKDRRLLTSLLKGLLHGRRRGSRGNGRTRLSPRSRSQNAFDLIHIHIGIMSADRKFISSARGFSHASKIIFFFNYFSVIFVCTMERFFFRFCFQSNLRIIFLKLRAHHFVFLMMTLHNNFSAAGEFFIFLRQLLENLCHRASCSLLCCTTRRILFSSIQLSTLHFNPPFEVLLSPNSNIQFFEQLRSGG